MDLNELYNPGKIMEEYLDFLPSKDAEAILFPMAKFPSKTFNVLDSETTLLYHVNKKIGINTVRAMLPKLCHAAGVSKCTNHQGI